MDCLRSVWEAGKTCCGPKTFYTVVAATVGVLLLSVGLVIALPIHLRGHGARVLVHSLPVAPATTVQVQGDSHSLVHIQEGIDASGPGGRPSIGGPIRHWGLVVAVGICSLLCIIALTHQVWRFVTFRPRTAEVPLLSPVEEARHLQVMEAQYRDQMSREMAVLMSQRSGGLQGLAGWTGSAGAPLVPVCKTAACKRQLEDPVPAPRALVHSAGVGGPPGSLLEARAEIPVCPPQVQVLGSVGARSVAPVSAGGVVPSPRSELRRLQQLRDDARWAEHQQVILRMGAPAFVPVVDRPGSSAQ